MTNFIESTANNAYGADEINAGFDYKFTEAELFPIKSSNR